MSTHINRPKDRSVTAKVNNDKPSTIELIKKWQKNRDREARRHVIEQNTNLVKSLVTRFSNSGIDEEDLMQIGFIGLVKAVDKFDYRKEVEFSTYAVPVILGEIKTFLRDDHPIKISRNLKELHKQAKEVKRWLILQLKREPTISEVAEELDVTKEELAACEEANQYPISLDKPTLQNEEANTPLVEMLPDSRFDSTINNKLTLQEILKKLDKKRRRLIVLRFFLEKSQKETGKILGLTQVQVSRMERRILETLQKEFIDHKKN